MLFTVVLAASTILKVNDSVDPGLTYIEPLKSFIYLSFGGFPNDF